jgi:hypothetical protein
VLEHVDAELRLTLMERDVPDDVLGDIQRRRERQHAGRFDAGPVLEGERMQLLDMLDATHTRGGTLLPSEYTTVGKERDWFGIPAEHVHWLNFVGLLLSSKEECVALADQLFAPMKTIDEPAHERRNESLVLRDVIGEVPMSMPTLGVGMPHLAGYVTSIDTVRTYSAATDLMLALARYHKRSGEYPESIHIPGAEVTDPMTGEPFGYKRLDPASDPFGRSYLLYSFGRDRRDDGGAGAKSKLGDSQLFKAQFKPGEDAIMNRARAEK